MHHTFEFVNSPCQRHAICHGCWPGSFEVSTGQSGLESPITTRHLMSIQAYWKFTNARDGWWPDLSKFPKRRQMRDSRLANLWDQDLRLQSCVEVTTKNPAGVAAAGGDLMQTVESKGPGRSHSPSCRGHGMTPRRTGHKRARDSSRS